MKNHTKIYFETSQLDPHGFTPCEICESQAVDIHHIDARGMGGDPTGSKDHFGNLQALCRNCHNVYGDQSSLKKMLAEIHVKRFTHLLEMKNERAVLIRCEDCTHQIKYCICEPIKQTD